MNKYRNTAKELAKTICSLMNLLYKRKESQNFKEELLIWIEKIRFKNNRWEFPDE